MVTQIAFKADQTLKDLALLKAKREGITLKAVLTYCMKSYVAGDISLWVVHRDINGFTPTTRAELLDILADEQNTTTGISKTSKELSAHLEGLKK